MRSSDTWWPSDPRSYTSRHVCGWRSIASEAMARGPVWVKKEEQEQLENSKQVNLSLAPWVPAHRLMLTPSPREESGQIQTTQHATQLRPSLVATWDG